MLSRFILGDAVNSYPNPSETNEMSGTSWKAPLFVDKVPSPKRSTRTESTLSIASIFNSSVNASEFHGIHPVFFSPRSIQCLAQIRPPQ
mmetsp:Transcript_31907/g.48459  ORF Transcript_31907/g.48459 Transcript_31907/m.48459 type:complete len:89 (+) Transcript_31907:2964-3230(+)